MTSNTHTTKDQVRRLVREAFAKIRGIDEVATWSSKPLSSDKTCGGFTHVSRRMFSANDATDESWGPACREIARFLSRRETSLVVDIAGPHSTEIGTIDAAKPDLGILLKTIQTTKVAGEKPLVLVVPIELYFPMVWQLSLRGDILETPSGSVARVMDEYDGPVQRILIYDPIAIAWNASSPDENRVEVDCAPNGSMVQISATSDLSIETLDLTRVWSVGISGAPLTTEEYRRTVEGV